MSLNKSAKAKAAKERKRRDDRLTRRKLYRIELLESQLRQSVDIGAMGVYEAGRVMAQVGSMPTSAIFQLILVVIEMNSKWQEQSEG